ncbi:MAG: ABC transporter permease [Firmicutes bacterium]|nr:ABC transporter permease [Bacillota bacterium]
MYKRIVMVSWKEFIQILRDPRMLAAAILMPLIMLILYGYAIDMDVKHIRLAVYDQNKSQMSRELIQSFSQSGYYDITASIDRYSDIDRFMNEGKARMVLVIPRDFSRDIQELQKATVMVMIDGSDSTGASTAIVYARAILSRHAATVSKLTYYTPGAHGYVPAVENRTQYWYNPELKSNYFIIPGLISIILMMLSALLTSVTIVRERERGTIEQLLVTPLKPHELILGKMIPYIAISFGNILIAIVSAIAIFHLPFVGSPVLFLIISAVYVIAALGLGILVSVISSSQKVALILAIMVSQLPSILLSGFIFPIQSMPKGLQWISNLIPATYFITILRSIFLKGSGFSFLWQSALSLLVISSITLLLSSIFFRGKL